MDPRGTVGRRYKEDYYTVHCYIQNMKALGLVVSEKIVLYFSHNKSMGVICCHGNQSSYPTCPKTLCNLFPASVMLLIKSDRNWPRGRRDIHLLKCGRTDGCTGAGSSTIL